MVSLPLGTRFRCLALILALSIPPTLGWSMPLVLRACPISVGVGKRHSAHETTRLAYGFRAAEVAVGTRVSERCGVALGTVFGDYFPYNAFEQDNFPFPGPSVDVYVVFAHSLRTAPRMPVVTVHLGILEWGNVKYEKIGLAVSTTWWVVSAEMEASWRRVRAGWPEGYRGKTVPVDNQYGLQATLALGGWYELRIRD